MTSAGPWCTAPLMGSYAVEAFSVDRFRTLDIQEVMDRVRDFRTMTTFELQPLARTHG